MGATMAGVFTLTAAFPGYLALCQWMEQFSKLWAGLMLAGCVPFFLPGVAHHVFCGALEWFYLRLDRTEEAREVVVFFQRHLCHHIPLIFGFAGLCAVSARGRGQRYHQLAPLNLSVQHAAPVFTAVPLAHCGYDEPGQRGNVFGAICFDLRCEISKRHSTPRQRGRCPRFAAGGGRCRSCGWRLAS